ncbi:hypothetical protein AMK06_PE00145 (plasmid) [Rhizobium sp. N541]|nr:hypothetical protein AMK05_PE00149 [Rhizobium sp. N324]ANM20905.1 hypothetical protein AMK06_PE00145 [Rhizobium sp. N541]ANM27280.1 hypothetical protein AMK07_PE00145 [Rhizobium sp. N941]OYC99621.1 hypothetical protein AMK08_PE00148 [Rhizobium sp. N4311]
MKRIDSEIRVCDLEALYRPLALKAVVAAYCIRSKIDHCDSRNTKPYQFNSRFHGSAEQER